MSVYFIACREIGRVKIGFANDVRRRLSELRTHCPLDLTLEAVVEGDMATESDLHTRFHGARVRGEWFAITPEIEELIAAHRPIRPSKPEGAVNPVSRLLTRFQISQHRLASRLGVTQATISRMAAGRSPISRRTELAVALLERTIEAEKRAAA